MTAEEEGDRKKMLFSTFEEEIESVVFIVVVVIVQVKQNNPSECWKSCENNSDKIEAAHFCA